MHLNSGDAAAAQEEEGVLVKRLCYVFAAIDDVGAIETAIGIVQRREGDGGEVMVELVKRREQWRALFGRGGGGVKMIRM